MKKPTTGEAKQWWVAREGQRVLQATREGTTAELPSTEFAVADVVILNGRLVKNRHGVMEPEMLQWAAAAGELVGRITAMLDDAGAYAVQGGTVWRLLSEARELIAGRLPPQPLRQVPAHDAETITLPLSYVRALDQCVSALSSVLEGPLQGAVIEDARRAEKEADVAEDFVPQVLILRIDPERHF